MEGRVMVFIDGTNLLVEMGKYIGIDKPPLRADNPPNSAILLASIYVDSMVNRPPKVRHIRGGVYYSTDIRWQLTRVYWYGSCKSDNETYDRVMDAIRSREYDPYLFKQTSGREKGVDIALTKDMLVHAFNHNFDIAILVAGDEDYVQLIEETKRYGGRVHVGFFSNGLSDKLKRASDHCDILEACLDKNTVDEFKEKISKELETMSKKRVK